jgi:hypothetical protein
MKSANRLLDDVSIGQTSSPKKFTVNECTEADLCLKSQSIIPFKAHTRANNLHHILLIC